MRPVEPVGLMKLVVSGQARHWSFVFYDYFRFLGRAGDAQALSLHSESVAISFQCWLSLIALQRNF